MPQTQILTHSSRRGKGLVARILQSLTEANLRRRDRLRLARLDPHMLRDIGLDPDTASQECAKPFWRP